MHFLGKFILGTNGLPKLIFLLIDVLSYMLQLANGDDMIFIRVGSIVSYCKMFMISPSDLNLS